MKTRLGPGVPERARWGRGEGGKGSERARCGAEARRTHFVRGPRVPRASLSCFVRTAVKLLPQQVVHFLEFEALPVSVS